jgi:CheY-like chemotaxis protein
MDVQMPIMDGVEATTHIRNSPDDRIRQTAIIALTAYAMAEDKEKFLRAGMDGYLSKPFEMKDLVKAVKEVLEKRRAKCEG